MPALAYTSSNFPFVPFTKIYSADVNQCFNDIKTLLNVTKLDSTNLQDAGLTVGKLNGSGAMPGQVATYNGTLVIWANSAISQVYNRIVGSAAQVTAGSAGYSSINTAIAAASADESILILKEYVTVENVSLNKRLLVEGMGAGSTVQGTITFAAGASGSRMFNVRATDNVTIDSTVDEIWCELILASGKTFIDNSDPSDINYLTAMQED